MDKKNLWIIMALVLVIAIVAVIGFVLPKQDKAPVITVTDPAGIISTIAPEPTPTDAPATDTPAPEATPDSQPADSEPTAEPETTPGSQPETSEPTPEPETKKPRAWLLITVDDVTYAPYALTKTGDYTINQKKKNAKNVIHVTEDSVEMASSSCDNQLCVYQGVVNLENKASRVLGNYIICLPNGVTLELLNEEEYASLSSRQQQ